MAARLGIAIESLVFPRNQVGCEHLRIAHELGLSAFRGNQRVWFHRASKETEQSLGKRAARFADSHLPIAGHHVHEPQVIEGMVDVVASRFLRPVRGGWLDRVLLERICAEMTHAAKTRTLFHLWWHPHNFGAAPSANLDFLRRVLDCFARPQDRFGIQSLNVGAVARRVRACQSYFLTQDSELGRVTANYLGKCFDGLITVFEEPVSPSALVRSRRKRLGTVVVAGQLAFTAFRRLQRYYSAGRVADIKRAFGLDDGQIQTPIKRVPSVNSNVCRALLRQLAPRVLLVMGTRIIGNETLHALYAPFVNYHAGITPKYRGVHGAYWALVEGDTEHCGVSVHLIDAGIDTGPILYQARIAPTGADNFSTYPYLQIAAGLPLLARAAKDALDGCLRPRAVDLPSGLWSHPTLWSYCTKGLGCGVW